MASIRKSKSNGKWFLDVRINGIRRRINLETGDKTVAQTKARRIKAEIERYAVPSSVKLEEFESQYFAWAAPIKAARTVEDERSTLRKLREITHIVKLTDLTPQRVDQFIAELATVMRPASVNYYIRTLRSIFGKAVRWELLFENPFAKAKLLRFELAPPRVLTREEIRKIFAKIHLQATSMAPLYEFYLLTGMRRNEALHLDWKEIDFERNVITVRNTKGKRFRYIPMLGRVVEILKARRDLQQPFALGFDHVSRVFKECAIAAKVPDVSLHDLRRSCASYLSEAGVPAIFIQQWLGHESFAITNQYYLSSTEEQWRTFRKMDLHLLKN